MSDPAQQQRAAHDDPAVGYGARPVSVDTTRRLPVQLAQPSEIPADSVAAVVKRLERPLNPEVIADRLALAHWPIGQQIFVCSLAGGVGRTTIAGLLATTLAEQPYAHYWPPVALHEQATRSMSSTVDRWDVMPGIESDAEARRVADCTRAGVWVFPNGQAVAHRDDFSVTVVDAPAGLPSDNSAVMADPGAVMVMLVRPDRHSLGEAADALVWMHDRELINRHRVLVVINEPAGEFDRGSKSAATALWIRCAGVHRFPFHSTLGPGRPLPSGHALPARIRRATNHVALDLWRLATTRRPSLHSDSLTSGDLR